MSNEIIEDLMRENKSLRKDIDDLQFHLKAAKERQHYDPKLAQAVAFLGLCVLRSGIMSKISNMSEVLQAADNAYKEMFSL